MRCMHHSRPGHCLWPRVYPCRWLFVDLVPAALPASETLYPRILPAAAAELSSRWTTIPEGPDHPMVYAILWRPPAVSSGRTNQTRSKLQKRRLRKSSSFVGLLSEMSIDELFRKRDTLELQHLRALVEPAVHRKAHLPRPREHFWILDGCLVPENVGASRRVTLDDVQRIAVKISGAIKPCLVVQTRHIND